MSAPRRYLCAMETVLIMLPVLILSVVFHEVAHGYVALRQGDQTAMMLGRLSLNPIPHLDPVGSLLVPGILALTGAPILGWARPVPVNPRNYRNYKRGDILVSLAGVAVNLALAIVFALLLALLTWVSPAGPLGGTLQILQTMMFFGVQINVVLILFNLLPIPPLDGSHVLYHLLPPALGARYREVGRYGFLVLFGLLFLTNFSFLAAPVRLFTSALLSFAGIFAAG